MGTDKEKTEKEQAKPTADPRLAAVRDLIFGENIQQYQEEFDEVRGQITALGEETTTNLSDLAQKLELKIDNLQQVIEKSIADLRAEMNEKIAQLDDSKTDRKKLGQALEKIALMLQE